MHCAGSMHKMVKMVACKREGGSRVDDAELEAQVRGPAITDYGSRGEGRPGRG